MKRLKKACQLKNDISKLEKTSQQNIDMIKDYSEGYDKANKKNKGIKMAMSLLLFLFLISFILGFFNDFLILRFISGFFIAINIGIYFFDYSEIVRKIKYYLDIKDTLLKNNISVTEFQSYEKNYLKQIELMQNEVLDIKRSIGFYDFLNIIKDKNDLSDQEFCLLEEWFEEYEKNNREHRSLKIEHKLQMRLNEFSLIENN